MYKSYTHHYRTTYILLVVKIRCTMCLYILCIIYSLAVIVVAVVVVVVARVIN